MATNDTRLLQLAHFATMTRWSAHSSAFGNVKSRFPLIPLSAILKRIKEPISIEDGVLYKRITIRNNGRGVVQRDELHGREIGTKRQFVAHAGQLIISRIDARNGAFGIVPKELDGAIVTNDFWLFEVKNALTEYLMLVLSSKRFQEHWQSQSSGTTNRQRVTEESFLETQIVLPTEKTQKYFCSCYDAKLNQADELITLSNKLKSASEEYFLSSLSVGRLSQSHISESILYTCRYRDLLRWDVWALTHGNYSSNRYQSVPFAQIVIGKPLYGANEKTIKEKSDIRYIRITDINDDGTLGNDFVSAANVDSKYILNANDFLIARSGNTVGKTFLYTASAGRAIFAGYLIKYVLDCEKVLPEYLFYYTKSSIFRQWVEGNKRIFGQPNINGKEYLSAPIILPPLDIQHEIVIKMRENVSKSRSLYIKAEECIREARTQFDEEVFNET